MGNLLDLAREYRESGCLCRDRLKEIEKSMKARNFKSSAFLQERRLTMLRAMSRDCIATSNYLKLYYKKREELENERKQ